jgi:hypothetical protein
MARYTLDYSDPLPTQRRRVAIRAQARRWPMLLALLGLCLGLVAFIYAYHLRAENYQLRTERNALLLRYDSLLAAQLYQERQRLRLLPQVPNPLPAD